MESTVKEVAITLGDLYVLVRRAHNVRIIRQALFNLAFVVLSIAICSWAHPVGEIWDVQEAILGQFIVNGRFGPGRGQTFRDIGAVDDFWLWMDMVLWPTLFPLDAVSMTSVSRCNRPLRALRLRQARVTPQACKGIVSRTAEGIEPSSRNICWPDFQEADQSSVPLQERRSWVEAPAVSEAFQVELPFRAGDLERGSAYGTRASILDVPFDCGLETVTSGASAPPIAHGGSAGRARCSELAAVLQQHAWIDEGTRALDLEMNLRNANHDLWTYLRFHFDFSAAGLVHPTVNIHSLQLWPHSKKSNGVLRCICELAFAVLLGIYTVLEAAVAWRHGMMRYWRQKVNLMRLASILMFSIGIVFWALYLTESREGLELDGPEFTDMLPLVHKLDKALTFIAVGVCMSCLLLLEVVRVYEPSAVFFLALQDVSAQVAQLLTAMLLCAVFFALAGQWLFGAASAGSGHAAPFSSVWASLSTLLRSLYGGLDGTAPAAHPAVQTDGFATHLAVYALLWILLVVCVFAGLVATMVNAQRRARIRDEHIKCWCTELSGSTATVSQGRVQRLPRCVGSFGACVHLPQASKVRTILQRIDVCSLLARIDVAIDADSSSQAQSKPVLGLEALVQLLGGSEIDAGQLMTCLYPESVRTTDGSEPAAGSGADTRDAAADVSGANQAASVAPAAVAVTRHAQWPPRVCVQAVHSAKAYMLTLSDQVSSLTLQVRRLTYQSCNEAVKGGVAAKSASRQSSQKDKVLTKDGEVDGRQDRHAIKGDDCGNIDVISQAEIDGNWDEGPMSARSVPWEVVTPCC